MPRGRKPLEQDPGSEWIRGYAAAAEYAHVSRTTLRKWVNGFKYTTTGTKGYRRNKRFIPGRPVKEGEIAPKFERDVDFYYEDRGGLIDTVVFRKSSLDDCAKSAAENRERSQPNPDKTRRTARPRPKPHVLSASEASALYDLPELELKDERSFTGLVKPRWLREVEADGVLYVELVERETEVYDSDGPRELLRKTYVRFPGLSPEEVEKYLRTLTYKFFGQSLPDDDIDPEYQEFRKISQKTS